MKNKNDTKSKIKMLLAGSLGVEPEDIEDEDSLTSELQMKPSDLTDFLELLESNGIDTSSIDFTEVDSFAELIESIGDEDYS